MTSSEEKPASAATLSTDDSESSDSGEQADAPVKPKKKTLIGLGKLRESLKKSSSGKKSSSLRLPKPRPRRKTTPGLSSPQHTSSEPENDDGPTTDRIEDIPEDTFDETSDAEEAGGAEDGSEDGEPTTDRIDGSLIDDIELPASDEPDEPMEAEATTLTNSPFEAEATMVTDSPLEQKEDEPKADEPKEGKQDEDEHADEFEAEATMVSDSLMGAEVSVGEEFDGGGKTTVSTTDTGPRDAELERSDSRPLTHRTNPNPPTPEQKPRSGNFSVPSSLSSSRSSSTGSSSHASSPSVEIEATLTEDTDASDDDFHAEKTEVFDSPYENEALVARLSILSGPAAGQEFLLNKQRNTIGRGKNNTIVVSDLAMSRQHLEILEQNDKTYLLVDLQAANGTRLNSTRVVEAELMHGDRIEAGKSELQFIIPGNRPQQRSRNRHFIPKREATTPKDRTVVRQRQGGPRVEDETTDKLLTYVIIGAGVLSLVLIAAAVFLFLNDSSTPEPTAQAVATEDPEAQALYLEAVEEVKDRKWDAARDLFEKVGQTDPDFPGVAAQLERVGREKRAQQTLEQAQSLFEDNKSEEAAKLANQVSNQSVYFEDAQSLLRKTRQQRVAVLYEKAQEEVTAENLEQAQTYLAAILKEVPNHKGAIELQETVMAAAEEAEEEAEEEAKSERRAARRASASKDDWLGSSGSRSSRSSSGGSTRVNFTKGFTLYKSGKFDRAAAHFKSAASRSHGAVASRATKTAKGIERFEKTYTRASRAFDAGAWKTAIDGLEQAKRADRSVARSGYFRSEVNAKLATAHGKIGLNEFAKGNFASANRRYAKGRKYQSSNSTVNTLRNKLSNKARGLYIQAANKRKTDPAKAQKLCRQIMAMVPSSHSMHQKAKKMLSEL